MGSSHGIGARWAFVEPPWEAPLDPAATLRAIPETATIAGMYPDAVLAALNKQGKRLLLPRERYLPFGFYPLREHVQLLLDAVTMLFPKRSLRHALRSLGRAAPAALLSSTLGRVLLGSSEGVLSAIESIVKSYPINVRPSRAELVEHSERHAVVHLSEIYFFPDSHHVGVFEGTLRHAGAKGQVAIATVSATEIYLRCSWEPAERPSLSRTTLA